MNLLTGKLKKGLTCKVSMPGVLLPQEVGIPRSGTIFGSDLKDRDFKKKDFIDDLKFVYGLKLYNDFGVNNSTMVEKPGDIVYLVQDSPVKFIKYEFIGYEDPLYPNQDELVEMSITCGHCGLEVIFFIWREDYISYSTGLKNIDEAFPYLSVEAREMLKTRKCTSCLTK